MTCIKPVKELVLENKSCKYCDYGTEQTFHNCPFKRMEVTVDEFLNSDASDNISDEGCMITEGDTIVYDTDDISDIICSIDMNLLKFITSVTGCKYQKKSN